MPLLHWLTRDEDLRAADRVPYRLLDEVPDLSAGEGDEGLLVQGDNLEALKALLPFYAGRVKCIYIDPPYNTRSAFEHYDDSLEHAKWLAMIVPRLMLLREFLSEDGSIWVSIDDNEGHYLKVVMDEIFGRRNFVDTVTWQMIYTRKNSARYFTGQTEFILPYAKNKDSMLFNMLPRSEEQNKNFKNPDNDPRGSWIDSAMHARNFYSKGSYEVISPSGKKFSPPQGRYWSVSQENFRRLDQESRIWWGPHGSNAPRKKTFLDEVKQGVVPGNLWTHSDAGHNAQAKDEAKRLFSEGEIFITPKPERLIQRILHIATNSGDLVLDSFLGSGTTAAVAHKMGRRWIGVEMGEHARTHCALRLQKVVEGEQGGISKDVGWEGGGGFRFCALGSAVFDEDGRIDSAILFADLAHHVWFSETRQPMIVPPTGPLLGVHGERAVALLYNGILKDRSPGGGNVLTRAVLKLIRDDLAAAEPDFEGDLVVYGAACRLSEATLKEQGIQFRQTPYDISART
ncbi:site-specific DNA-methyltransferase [Roseivivax sp. GX 12232]|uniref:site-specific DNA-methyltransferase n=1 Tax=Roseivivax sp. GX 12232 TaxID=2900547 RepID=UPI001E5C9A97|nr:site-specific DNA-methyltransferase [Roseivivax sp. GX 12232]MCE0506116.1 site-specific DNA-methyltransferase [Roseivivax sp. GX 12232]